MAPGDYVIIQHPMTTRPECGSSNKSLSPLSGLNNSNCDWYFDSYSSLFSYISKLFVAIISFVFHAIVYLVKNPTTEVKDQTCSFSFYSCPPTPCYTCPTPTTTTPPPQPAYDLPRIRQVLSLLMTVTICTIVIGAVTENSGNRGFEKLRVGERYRYIAFRPIAHTYCTFTLISEVVSLHKKTKVLAFMISLIYF